MKVIKSTGNSELAAVYIAKSNDGKMIEFVESTQPPLTFRDKHVLVISTLYGCPVECKFCDAGGSYGGQLSLEDIKFQVDYVVDKTYENRNITTERFKIQFARMGEPTFNVNVIEFLEKFPELYKYKSFTASLSTIGPNTKKSDDFLSRLIEVKNLLYKKDFQLQFSLHSTDEEQRNKLIPVRKLSFAKIAEYAEKFYSPSGKKVTLNFAIADQYIVEPEKLLNHFSPDIFIIKITPLNPTATAMKNGLRSLVRKDNLYPDTVKRFFDAGYDVILSVNDWDENKIGSNCGQYINNYLKSETVIEDSYTSILRIVDVA